jgi:Trk K+ transport system NAD-binding subunit
VVRGELDESETYTSARVGQARAVFASLDDPTNTSIILTALEACPTVQILALAEHEESVDLLELAGASHVLSLKQRLGEQLANRAETRYSSAHVIGQFEDLFIAEFLVYRTPLVGKTLVDAQLRQATGVNVVGVWERGRLQQAGPKTLLRDSSIPVVVGTQGQIDALENQIRSEVENGHPVIVVGAGRVGRATAEALLRKGLHVHLLDRDPNVIAQMQPFEGETFVGEGADRALLMRAGVKNASSVVLTTNDDATNIYLSIYFRKLNPDLIIVARITHERNIESIHRAGADFVLSYSSLGQESVMAIVQKREFVFLGGDVDFYVFPVPALLAGTTLRTSGIGARTGLNIIGVRQADGLHNPGPDTSLADGATLIAIGTPKQRSEFKKVFE